MFQRKTKEQFFGKVKDALVPKIEQKYFKTKRTQRGKSSSDRSITEIFPIFNDSLEMIPRGLFSVSQDHKIATCVLYTQASVNQQKQGNNVLPNN